MNIVQRTVSSTIYNIAANVIGEVVGFIGTIILARLLEPEVFGVMAFVSSVVLLSLSLPNFGLQGAFMRQTGGKAGVTEESLRVFFTLRLLFSLIWAVVMVAGVLLFAPAHTRLAFWIVIACTFFMNQTMVITTLLARRVQFLRLAITQAVCDVATTILSIVLAWLGWGIWALLFARVLLVIINVTFLFIIRPVWKPRLGWSKELVRHYLSFGSKVFLANILDSALDRVDDVYTGSMLHDRVMGFYDKAYGFATYPRALLVDPLRQVVVGTYAQLSDDRPRLSQTFSMVNELVARVNFWMAAVLWLIAPEFIRLALGVKWMPIMQAFQLMLVFTMFDPLKSMVGSVIVQCGAPERVIRARVIQLVVMVIGLFALGPRWNIAGVALAVDIMLIVGIVIFYIEARRFVDYSLKRIFTVPTLALVLGTLAALAALKLPGVTSSDWISGAVKIAVVTLVYAAIVIIFERKRIPKLWKVLRQVFLRKKVEVESTDKDEQSNESKPGDAG
jgi:O-antigen/teichoic acid export membrane protein